MKFGAIHTPNVDAHYTFAGATLNKLPIIHRKDWFKPNSPADGNVLLNDRMGCCVPVARDWWVKAFIGATTGRSPPISNSMILEDYMLNGYDPKDPSTDRGVETSGHMLRWQAEPALDIDGSPHAIYWTRANPLTHFAEAMSLSPCLATLWLPDAFEQEQDLEIFGRAPESGTGWDPNPAIGHRVLVGAFATPTRGGRGKYDIWVNTWGEQPYMHWEFFVKYLARTPGSAAPDGFDVPIPRGMSDDMMLEYAGLDLESFQTHMIQTIQANT